MSLPRARHDCSPSVISVSMSAIFFCISWFLARGTPNWILIEGHTDMKSKGWCWHRLWIFCLAFYQQDNVSVMPIKGLELEWPETSNRILLTCLECTDERHGSRIQLLRELPMQCHTGHCSDSQRDPGHAGGVCRINTARVSLQCLHKIVGFVLREQSALTARPETLGSRFSWGTSTSSIRIMPVADALSENLPSILGVAKPFIPRSRMKPRTRSSSHFAHTTAISATGEFVILEEEDKGFQTRGSWVNICYGRKF